MGRFWNIVKAKLSRLLGAVENPDETLDYSYEQQLTLLQDVKEGVVQVTTAKKRLQGQVADIRQNMNRLEDQARSALQAGREDLATRALERKAVMEQDIANLEDDILALEDKQEQLVENERNLARKVESFRTQKEVIKANYSAAEAQVKIGEAATGIGKNMMETNLAIGRVQDRVEQMEARANAIGELAAAGALEDFTDPSSSLDRELADIAAGEKVEKDLARLKAEIGPGKKKEIGS